MVGSGAAGGFMSLNGYHRALYDRGGDSFIDEQKVNEREMKSISNQTVPIMAVGDVIERNRVSFCRHR